MRHIVIATEDALTEVIAERLIEQYTDFHVHLKLGRQGNSLLRSKLKNYSEMAKRYPFLLITDLDSAPCAVSLISEWKQSINIDVPDNLLFRVAVREVEAWLLADHHAIGELFNVSNIIDNPDSLGDPKRELLRLAEKAPRDIREDLVIKRGANASRGLGYNQRLSFFVRNAWCPERASERSESLRRCRDRLKQLMTSF